MFDEPIYLDYNATTPVDPEVVERMLPFFTETFGNPSSIQHSVGVSASEAVEAARDQIARLIGGEADEIIFTSGATESDNLAIKGAAEAEPSKRHIISSPTEHHAVLDCLGRLGRSGYAIDFLPVDRYGVVDVSTLPSLIRRDTLMVTVMAANNEIGTLAPIDEIGAITRSTGVLFHTDAAQLIGKLPLDVNASNIDLLSISAHKIYGPKGIGALYVRRRPRVHLAALMDGGGHERGLRSGTLNTPGCVGLGAACEIFGGGNFDSSRISGLRARLYGRLSELLGEAVHVNGHPDLHLPGTLNVQLGVDADSLMLAVPDVAMSSGSACTAASPEPSYVLRAIGLSYEHASQSIRFGIGRPTTNEEVDAAAARVANGVARLRSVAVGAS